MSTKKLKKNTYKLFNQSELREVDKSLYCLLQIAFDLKLISSYTLHHATTCDTNLFYVAEDK
jgi:hypothetical protein